MDPETQHRRLLQLLAHERALHGHGSAADIDQRIGRSEGYLGRVLRGEIGLQTEMMFRVLTALDTDEATFFTTLVGTKRDPLRCLNRLARSLKKTMEPPFIPLPKTFQRRLDGLLEGHVPAPTHRQPPELTTWIGRLRDTDAQRFVDPEGARDQISRWLPEILRGSTSEPAPNLVSVLPRALGVAASIERVAGRSRHAARYLQAALRLELEPLSPQYAELLLRACYQLGDRGDPDAALDIAQQAMDVYLQVGDLPGVGRALVDRAAMAFRMGPPHTALNLYRAGLQYLSEMDWTSRFTALQGMGMAHLRLGQVEEAEGYARLAAKTHHHPQEGLNWWRLVWLQAEIAYRRQDLPRAIRFYGETREAFKVQGHALDAALLSLQKARVLVISGKLLDIQHLAAWSLSLLKPLRRHPVACAVLNDFARLALTQELTVPRIDRMSARLETSHPEGWSIDGKAGSIEPCPMQV